MTEVQNAGKLTLGLVDYENSWSIDYPIPSNASSEHSYFFFRLIAKLIKNSVTLLELERDFYEDRKKKIKRLEIFTSILYQNISKKKFKKLKNFKKSIIVKKR
jgi:hypothetical protein